MKPAARLFSGLVALAALSAGSAQAASFGHARLASAAGEPLLILVPVSDLTQADLQALSARPAPAPEWAQAGLTPPVALDTLSVSVGQDVRPGARRVLRISSSQAFSGSLADLLLDVHTATGDQRYQVSLVAPGPLRTQPPASGSPAAAPSGAAPALGAAGAPTSVRRIPAGSIRVRQGDTMFAIARRHAVDGVSVYQLMMALQRANPQAFIRHNINLVRAGASLGVPDVADMLSISDAEARRQFVEQTAAFNRMRGHAAAQAGAPASGPAAEGAVSSDAAETQSAEKPAPEDQVRLSQGGAAAEADARTAKQHALRDAESRVDQLQDNVQHLNQALQAQGEAARHAAADGAQAISQSISQIASAISEASHDAVAQADEQAAPAGQAAGSGGASQPAGEAAHDAAGGAGAASAGAAFASAAGTAAAAASSGVDGAASGAPASGDSESGNAASSGSAPGNSTATNSTTANSSTGNSSTGASAPGAASTTAAPGGAAASAGGAGLSGAARVPGGTPGAAPAEAAELQPSVQAEHRASWIQDHLLGVMTALLAVIVFIIAWLLRRANTARDDAADSPQVTEAMVREKLQGVDLELPARDAAHTPPRA